MQIGFGQERALWLKAQRGVQGALHAAQSNEGSRDQQSAECNLNAQEKIAKREAPKDNRGSAAALHHLGGIRRPDLPHGNQAPQHSACNRQQQGHQEHFWIGSDGHMNWKFRKRLPARQSIQQGGRKKCSQSAAENGEEDRLGKQLTEDIPPAGTNGKADGEFAAAICGARCKEACEVRARRQQHQKCEQHNARQEGSGRVTEHVAQQSGFYKTRAQGVICGILARQFLCDGVEIIGGLLRSDGRLQLPQDPDIVHATVGKKVCVFRIRAVDDGHPEIEPQEQVGSVKASLGDSDDRKRMLINIDRSANNAGIRIEMSAPKIMTQDDIRSRVQPMFIACMKEPAMLRLHAQHVKVIPGDLVVPAFVGSVFCAEACPVDPVSRHIAEGRILGPKIHVVGVGLIVVPLLFVHDVVKAVGPRDVERAQNQRIQHAEHDDVRADSED